MGSTRGLAGRGIATACPRPACGPGWQAGQVSERGVGPVLSWPARGRAHIREMMPFESKRIFRTCLTQTGAKYSLIFYKTELLQIKQLQGAQLTCPTCHPGPHAGRGSSREAFESIDHLQRVCSEANRTRGNSGGSGSIFRGVPGGSMGFRGVPAQNDHPESLQNKPFLRKG